MTKFEGNITCPFCGHRGGDFSVLKEWYYGYLFVNYVECVKCNNRYRINWGENNEGEYIEYTMPKGVPL